MSSLFTKSAVVFAGMALIIVRLKMSRAIDEIAKTVP
jgi:hypothetical protein